MKPFVKALVCIICLLGSAKAQNIYTLKQCISIAQENNIVAQQAKLNNQQTNVSLKTAKYAQLPNLNASVANNYNFGRTIDPFTNAYINQNVTAVSMNLGSQVTLFNGFRLRNNLESALNNQASSNLNLEAINNNVALDVAALYLSVLMTTEQIKTFESNIKQTQEQLDRVNILINAGAATIDRKLELEAQLSNDEFQLINAQNNKDLALLNLKIYMNLGANENLTVEPIGDLILNKTSTDTVDIAALLYNNYKRLPEVKRDELLFTASEFDLLAAKGNRLPSLNFSASLNSLYSSRSQKPINPRIETFQIGYVEGLNNGVFTSQQVYDYTTPGFFEQFENNFGQTFGLSLSVPIFNRNQVSAAIESASINNQRQYLQLQNTKNQVQNNIYQAFLNLQAAQKAFDAAEKAYNAQKALLNQTELRYNAGAISYFDYLTARNNYTNAEITLMKSKYDLIFKEKTFGFYLGNEISL